jgi:uncharacterized membrane protein
MKTRLSTFLTAACCALLFPVFALAQPAQPPAAPPPWDWPGHWHMWGGWGFWWIFPLFMFFTIAVCIAIFFFFTHRMCGGHHHWGPWHMMDRSSGDPTFSALQLLNERYAKGRDPESRVRGKEDGHPRAWVALAIRPT